jgi:ABC-type Na+ transport system ATPase subunit NatA
VTDQTQPSLFPEESEKPFLDSFTIGAFRGLRDLTLDHLGRINLLVGKNNSGKTSVLEALAIFAQPEDFAAWVKVARSRNPNNLLDALEGLFPHVFTDINEARAAIELTGRGRTDEQHIRAFCEKVYGVPPEEDETDQEEDHLGDTPPEEEERLVISGVSIPNGGTFNHAIWRHNGFLRPRAVRPKTSVILLPPYSHRSGFDELNRTGQAIRENYLPEVELLLQKIDKDIGELLTVPLPNSNRARLMIRHKRIGLAPISVFGDGVRRALSIALAVPPARNGLLLIDEIESALHVSVLDTLYPWLVEACAEYNVQLFATTHSLEAVDAIAKLDKSINGGLSAYHLSDNTDEIRRYTGGMLHRLVHQRGLDIR